jgi:hypothetical protein
MPRKAFSLQVDEIVLNWAIFTSEIIEEVALLGKLKAQHLLAERFFPRIAG